MIRVALLALLSLGCNQLNQVVFGVAGDLATQGAAPQIDAIAITLLADGQPLASPSFRLGEAVGEAQLPASIVAYSLGGRLPTVDVTVGGLRAGAVVVERRARVTLRSEQTRFVRLALERRCIGVACADGETCIEGSCQPVDFDLGRALPYLSGDEFVIGCDDPGFLSSVDDMPLEPAMTSCAAGQACIEGTCYQPVGATPIAGAGQLGIGSLGDYQIK